MSDPQALTQALRRKLEDGERGGTDENRDVLLEFSDRLELLREEYSWHRHLKLLRHCTRMAEHAGSLSAALEDRDVAEDIVRWIHREYDNEETNRDYRVALRVFARRVTEDDEVPDSVAWVSSKTSRSYDPSPDPAKMLRWDDDIEPMLDACRNPRDAALIALQFDAGLRGGELYDLRVSDVSRTDHGLQVRVDGKTGQRSVDLIPSTPYVSRWLAEHPGGDDDYLWTRLSEATRYSYQRFTASFKEVRDRTDVTKPVTPTHFRKSNASWLARQNANAALIEDRQGRARGSAAVARYVARFGGDDAGAQYAALHGRDVETTESDAAEIAPVVCPSCDRETPRSEERCVWCGQALSAEAAAEARNQNEALRDAIRRFADQPDKLDAWLDVQGFLDEYPQTRTGVGDD